MTTDRAANWSRTIGCACISLAAVGILLASWSDLPDRVATRWNLTGQADASSSKLAILVFVILFGVLAVLGPWRAARHPSPGAPVSVFLGFLVAGLDLGLVAVIVSESRGVRRWQDTSMPSGVLIISLVGSVVVAGVASRGVPAVTNRRRLHPHAPLPLDHVDLAASNHAVTAMSAVLLVVALVGASESLALGLAIFVVACVVVLFAHVDIGVDRHGIDVHLSPWRFPHWRVPVEKLVSARVVTSPARLSFLKHRAIVIRSGPSIRCDLVDGGSFVVGADDPEEAAELLRDMIDRLGTTPSRR